MIHSIAQNGLKWKLVMRMLSLFDSMSPARFKDAARLSLQEVPCTHTEQQERHLEPQSYVHKHKNRNSIHYTIVK